MGWFGLTDDEEEQKKEVQPPLDPSVANYMKQKMGLDKAYAQEKQDAGDRNSNVGMIQGLSTIFAGRDKTDGGFYNNLRAENQKGVDRADSDRKDLEHQFQTQRTLKDWEQKDGQTSADNDPNSMQSEMARQVASRFNVIPADKLQGMSAGQLKQHLPAMKDIYEAEMKKQEKAQAIAAAQAEKKITPYQQAQLDMEQKKLNLAQAGQDFKQTPKTYEQRLQGLNATDKARFDNSVMASKALHSMDQALADGQSTYSMFGDNDFTNAQANWEEAIGRMQSGGAINSEEAKRFKQLAPTTMDSDAMRQKKLKQLNEEMGSRLNTLGFQRGEVPSLASLPEVKRKGASGTATAAPAAKPVHQMTEEEIDAELKALGK